jgi:catechol 2,3-dioxygenase-like lactoylglutathione lyase family enzyme
VGTLAHVRIQSLDHLVLTVANVEATVAFYETLGMRRETFGEGRIALRFGDQKINLHQRGAEISPNAAVATPGSADLCFLVADSVDEVVRALEVAEIEVELGPVSRTGATSALTSIYIRDPDGNLVELSQLGSATGVSPIY